MMMHLTHSFFSILHSMLGLKRLEYDKDRWVMRVLNGAINGEA